MLKSIKISIQNFNLRSRLKYYLIAFLTGTVGAIAASFSSASGTILFLDIELPDTIFQNILLMSPAIVLPLGNMLYYIYTDGSFTLDKCFEAQARGMKWFIPTFT